MSSRNLPGLVAFALLAFAGPSLAFFNNPTLLFDTPTADVLPAGKFAVSADVTGPLTQSPANVAWWEVDANVRFSPVKHLDFAVTAFTLKDYVIDAKYQLVGGEPERFGLAVGVYDVGIHNYVSPIGNGPHDAWPDWRYEEEGTGACIRPYEIFSAYAVTSIPVASYARLHLGLGRGRFAGYDGPNRFLNTGYLLKTYDRWTAVALFGGAEVFITPDVALVLEANTRDLNTGIKADFGPVTAAVAWTKMEGLLWAYEERRFGRIELGATYKFGPLTRQPKPEAPSWPQELPPPPAETTPPIAEVLRLYPIWFRWDKWDITPVAEATLRRNADVILSHPNITAVTLLGYASEEGTLAHNLPLSGRRANAALEYLKSLGVSPEKMTTRAMGESPGRPLPMHRSVYFELELEK